LKKFLGFLLFLAILGGVGAYFLYNWVNNTGTATGLPVKVTIPSGSSAATIATRLEQRGVIENALAFRLYLKSQKVRSELRAGDYQLRTGLAFSTVLQKLKKGPAIEYVKLVIPEGLNIDQASAQVGRLTHISAEDFKAAAERAVARPAILPPEVKSLEGFLYPTTYFVDKKETAASLVGRMVKQFDEEAAKAGLPEAAQAVGRTPYEIMTIASLIEEEAKAPEEREKISAVINNRLRTGMPLGIDATVQYIVGKYSGQPLTVSDLENPSPYNTRIHAGLPPGPISSPRESSIEAALHPAPTQDLYYVLTGDCLHHLFTPSYSEFLAGKAAKPKGC
jgi:UPF0755 protein